MGGQNHRLPDRAAAGGKSGHKTREEGGPVDEAERSILLSSSTTMVSSAPLSRKSRRARGAGSWRGRNGSGKGMHVVATLLLSTREPGVPQALEGGRAAGSSANGEPKGG